MTHKSLSSRCPFFFPLKNTCFCNETESAWNRKKMKERERERVRGQSMHAKHPSESDIYVRILWQGRRNEWRCVMHPLPLVKWEAKRLKMGVFFFLPNLNRVSRERNKKLVSCLSMVCVTHVSVSPCNFSCFTPRTGLFPLNFVFESTLLSSSTLFTWLGSPSFLSSSFLSFSRFLSWKQQSWSASSRGDLVLEREWTEQRLDTETEMKINITQISR